MNADIFRAYDIRGSYPSDLNEEIVYKIGAALADKITINRKAVVAMDGRLSGPHIKAVSYTHLTLPTIYSV